MAVKKASKAQRTVPAIQDHFIARFKQVLPPGIGMAEEIADILEVSIDSAYRRIRGETELTIEEIYKISKRYAISIDEVFSNRSDTVTFAYTKLTDSSGNFEDYLHRLTNHMKAISKFENKKIYYVAEEIPLFYSFAAPKFTDFKLFYWQRSVLNCPEYQQQKYERGLIPQKLVDLAQSCYKQYFSIPSVEVWTDLTVLTGLRQVGFYYDSGILTKEYALELLTEYRDIIEMIRKNAESGRKNISDTNETFSLYCSDVVLGTNCIYTIMGESRYSFISFNTLNSLTTNNPEFCQETEHWMRNLEKKSTLISGVGEKQRYQFFSSMFKKIDDHILRIQSS
jgi:transcriptional regulator with XRE-family HTH domain